MSTTSSYTSLQKPYKHRSTLSDASTAYEPSHVETLDMETNSNARRLGQWSFWGWAGFLMDVILALVPLFFIVLAIMAASLNGKPISSFGASVEEIITLSPTIFPIVFAALMGKFFKVWALYRAERGTRLGSLEQLVGCQSLFGAIERQITIRHSNVVGLIIVVIWALSPVGGQSALRLLTRSPRSIQFSSIVRYLPMEAAENTMMDGSDDMETGWPIYAPAYMAALETAQPLQNSTMDLWGNVRIPTFESLSPTGSMDYGWRRVDYSNNITYSSFIGIPIGGLPNAGNSTFNVTSRYWDVDCPNVYEISNYTGAWNTRSSFTMTVVEAIFINDSSADTVYSFNLVSMMEPPAVSVANCTVSARDVVSTIECVGIDCHAVSMQLSPLPVSQRLWIEVTSVELTWYAFPLVTVGIISHQAEGSIMGSTPTEMWLVDPDTDFQETFFVNLSALSPPVLSDRLQKVYNTFWQTTYGTQYLVGRPIPANLTFYYDDTDVDPWVKFNNTLAKVKAFDGELYSCRWRYAALLSIISSILLVAAVTSLILKSLTLAPDILGFVSTYTRDNPNVVLGTLSDQPSYLDGLARARALRELRVMIGDVNGESEVGHVAFADMRREPQRLTSTRFYD